MKEKKINEIKSNGEESVILTNVVQIIYDRVLKTGFVMLIKAQMKKFNIKQNYKKIYF